MSDIERHNHEEMSDIKGFSIIEKEGRKFLHIILKENEHIEIEVSLHVKELYNLLSGNEYQKTKSTFNQLIEWVKNKLEQERQNNDILMRKRLDLPENSDKKEIMGKENPTIDQIFKRLEIANEFHDCNKEEILFTQEDRSTLSELNRLLKIIDAAKEGVFLPTTKILDAHLEENTEKEYGREEVISKERIKKHLSTLEKLFKSFEKTAFSKEDPRPYEHLNEDERRLLDWELTSRRSPEEQDNIEDNEGIVQYNNALVQVGLKSELERIFGERATVHRRFEEFMCDNEDKELSKGTKKILYTANEIYKKLLLIGLYYKGELYIKTSEDEHPFTGNESRERSIDGMVYYKKHQERYADNIAKFMSDRFSGRERDVHIPLYNIKIEDLSYGALEDVLALLGESDLAPAFYMVLSYNLFPMLRAHNDTKQENAKNNDKA